MNLPPNIFVFYEDKQYCQLLQDVLSEAGYCVAITDKSGEIFRFLREERFFLIVLSVNKATAEHLTLVKQIKQNYPFTEVIFIVKWPNANSSFNAMVSGAKEFLSRSSDVSEYVHCVDALYKNVQKKYKKSTQSWTVASAGSDFLPRLVGEHDKIKRIREIIDKVAGSDVPVLVTGETGVGKELVTETIHKKSIRKDNPFCIINCGAIPETLLENELFGHEKGAFTGAINFKPGLLAEADTGTVFLDEIAELTPALQVKLLRAIETGKFRRLGGSEEIRVNVRVISATNKDLYAEVQKNRFRADLYYRLAVITISIPSLQERKEDIPALIRHFLDIANKRSSTMPKTISDSALKMLAEYDWPGNVRELKNCVERLVVLSSTNTIENSDVFSSLPNIITPNNFMKKLNKPEQAMNADSALLTVEEMEKRYIKHVFELTGGHQTKAAEILGISRRGLYDKLRIYGFIKSTEQPEISS